MELEYIKVPIRELFEHSVEVINLSACRKNLELLLDLDHELPEYAYVDPLRLKQILINLLNNSIKFTQEGEIELSVRYHPMNTEEGIFSVSIRDTGIGINLTQKDKLFKAFSQADSSTTRKYGGTGLGLVISQKIAQKMGATIEFESQEQVGSRFYFSFTAKIEAGQAFDLQSLPGVKTCLLIDDNDRNRELIKNTLQAWGIDCVDFKDGPSGLAKLKESSTYDILLLDFHMPQMDGIETLLTVRKDLGIRDELLPTILFHSASDDEKLFQLTQDLQIHQWICKPVKQSQLFQSLVTLPNNLDKLPKAPILKTTDHHSELAQKKSIQKETKEFQVLIAEDVPMNMILTKTLIKTYIPHARFLEANNGSQAVQIYREFKPDLIFMDVQMPGVDGLEATKEIRELESGTGQFVPIVALTAGALKEEMERCYEAGMDHFLTKPIEKDKLQTILNKILAK